MRKTVVPAEKDIKIDWHLLDADGEVLGRLASRAAELLMGKHKAVYSRNMVVGDHVVVINAASVRVTGRKEKQKIYYRYSGYPSGLSATPLFKMRKEHPERIIEHAVSGMLPKNKLKTPMMKRLHVFSNSEHPYQEKLKRN